MRLSQDETSDYANIDPNDIPEQPQEEGTEGGFAGDEEDEGISLDEWKEEDCNRADNGQFGEGSGGSAENERTQAEIEKEIDEVIEKALNDPNARQKVKIGKVDDKLSNEAKKAGFNIEGYEHDIDVSGVKHAFNEHGNAAKEAQQGQIAVTDNDIKKIPDIIKSYDSVKFGEKDRSGMDLIVYSKKMTDGTTIYVEEIRTGKKTLTTKSMRKKKR